MSEPQPVRLLNEDGISEFEAYLRNRKQSGENDLPPPEHLLTDESKSSEASFEAQVESTAFPDRLELAKYLDDKLGDAVELERDPGLWSWLALFYIDQICPSEKNLGKLRRYVMKGDETYQDYYRHQIYGPYSLYEMYGEDARLMLFGPVHEHPGYAEQFASRDEIVTNEALMQVADRLYYDEEAGEAKTGGSSRKRPGNIRRLVQVAYQLDITYDLYGMEADQILSILPNEFDEWAP